MPLRPGKSKKTMLINVKEMLESSTFAGDKSEKKRQQMAWAAAYDKARKGGGKFPKKKSRKKKR
jgi:hypothetical protein